MDPNESAGSAPEIRVDRDRSGEGDGAPAGKGSSVWEWIVAGLSTVLVLGLIGYMLYEAIAVPATPPRFSISVDSVIPTPHGYLAEFSVRNEGSTTARGLVMEGELRGDTGSIETSQVTIDYVPARARRRAGLHFVHDPREHRLEIRPKGFDRP